MAQKKSAPFDSTIPVRGRKLIEVAIICYPIRTIPVRGRKLRKLVRGHVLFCTIPVRGRKQVCGRLDLQHRSTIPVRGRKHAAKNDSQPVVSTIPVRGQKTPHQKMRSFFFANLNFLFSVGCSSMNGTIAAAVIFSLLRLLHGDKMCYNKANSKHLLQNQQIRFPFIVQFFHNP